jgi:hypothetical protein
VSLGPCHQIRQLVAPIEEVLVYLNLLLVVTRQKMLGYSHQLFWTDHVLVGQTSLKSTSHHIEDTLHQSGPGHGPLHPTVMRGALVLKPVLRMVIVSPVMMVQGLLPQSLLGRKRQRTRCTLGVEQVMVPQSFMRRKFGQVMLLYSPSQQVC